MRRRCGFVLVLLFIYPGLSYPKSLDRFNPLTKTKFSQYQCAKLSTCTKGGDKVCGYDESTGLLGEFKDLCNFHKTNCEGIGMYLEVDMVICDSKKAFQNETFEFEHVQPVTLRLPTAKNTNVTSSTISTTMSPVKILNNSTEDDPTRLMGVVAQDKGENLFAKYSCTKLTPCTVMGDKEPVCAIDYKTKEIVEFRHICMMYYANCHALGMYMKMGSSDCKPARTFGLKEYRQHQQKLFMEANEHKGPQFYLTTAIYPGSDEEFPELTTQQDRLRSEVKFDLPHRFMSVLNKIRNLLHIRRNRFVYE